MITIIAAMIGGLMLMIGSALLYYKFEWKALVLFSVILAVVLIVSRRAVDAPLMVAPFLMGCIGGYSFKKEKSFGFFLLASSLTITALVGGYFYYMMLSGGADFFEMLKGVLGRSLDAAKASADIKMQLMDDFEASKEYIPFSTFLNSVFFSGLGYVLIKNFLTRTFHAGTGKGIEYFRLNEYFIFILIAGLAVFLLVDKRYYPVISIAGLNVVLSAALLYFIQALGIIKFLLIRRGMPLYIMPLVVFLIFSLGIFGIFLAIILSGFGVLDIWADFRKMFGRKESDEKK